MHNTGIFFLARNSGAKFKVSGWERFRKIEVLAQNWNMKYFIHIQHEILRARW